MVVQAIEEAEGQLAQLVEKALAGEEVVLSREGEPVARIVPEARRWRRQPGKFKGQIWIAEDFDEWPHDIAVALGIVDE